MPGPTMPCFGRRSRRSSVVTPQRLGGSPRRSRRGSSQSPLRSEARLIEARAAAFSGHPKDAVAILESLVGPSAGSPETRPNDGEKKAPAPALSPALAAAARYDLALAYRAIGRAAEADAILASSGESAAWADHGGRPIPRWPVASGCGTIRGSRRAARRISGRQSPRRCRRICHGTPGDGPTRFGSDGRRLEDAGPPRQEFPESKSLPPARLRVAEAALKAHQAERAAEQFKLVAGNSKPSTGRAPSPALKPVDATTPALQVRAYRGLGRALAELGSPAEAAAAFRAALELAPDDPTAPEVALAEGRALEDGHQTDAALKAYSRVQDRFAKSTQAAQAGLARRDCSAKPGGTARHREIRAIDRRRARSRHWQRPAPSPTGYSPNGDGAWSMRTSPPRRIESSADC